MTLFGRIRLQECRSAGKRPTVKASVLRESIGVVQKIQSGGESGCKEVQSGGLVQGVFAPP